MTEPDPQRRRELIGCLALMPDEAFEYVARAMEAGHYWPSISSLTQESRDFVRRAQAAAKQFMKV